MGYNYTSQIKMDELEEKKMIEKKEILLEKLERGDFHQKELEYFIIQSIDAVLEDAIEFFII